MRSGGRFPLLFRKLSCQKSPLDQYRNDPPGLQSKFSVTKHPKYVADGSRVSRHRDVRRVVIGEDLIEELSQAYLLLLVRLSMLGSPKRVVFCETSFDEKLWILGLNV